MKRLLLSSVALFGFTIAASAADLSRRTYVASAPYVAVPVFTWTGFYVGANAGYGFSDRDHAGVCGNGFSSFGNCFGGLTVQTNNGLAPVVPVTGFVNNFGSTNDRDRGGFVGGGQIGYNYQFTPGSGFVIGIEADIQAADFNGRDDEFFNLAGFGGIGGFGGFGGVGSNGIFTAAPVAPTGPGSGIAEPGIGAPGNVALFNSGFGNHFDRGRIDWFGTVRGRLGYAVDRFMIYVTGGGAFTDRDDGNNLNGFGFGSGVPNGAALVGTGFFANNVGATSAARAANLADFQAAGATVAPTNVFGSFSDRGNDNWGWTIGGGIEYAFTNNLTAKIEGLYVNFDRDHGKTGAGVNNVVGVSNTGAAVYADQAGSGFDNGRNGEDFAVVRAGLNWKFTAF